MQYVARVFAADFTAEPPMANGPGECPLTYLPFASYLSAAHSCALSGTGGNG
jgi:hypothetical protein